ncbi:hypothetical protein [Runella limosa]|uniref:hypothetical protein n=1 Tax=Runella limosa TaxID=370978 RepID=UPI0004169EB1|nr:hypothetical protein [Runella limosa]
MIKDDFLAEYREIILLENFDQARNDVMYWLRKQVEYQEKLQGKLDQAREKAFDNPAMLDEVKRLTWQVDNHQHGLAIIVAFLEASETALEVFREKMLSTIEMDSLKLNMLGFYQKAWLESMEELTSRVYKQDWENGLNQLYSILEERKKTIGDGSFSQYQKQNTSQGASQNYSAKPCT